jgi:6-phosphogluconolactonase/glucosamine-6-phosphate isomerase/deaminase
MSTTARKITDRRPVGENVWIGRSHNDGHIGAAAGPFGYKVFQTEAEVGAAMFDELVSYSKETEGDIVIVLLGGRGAQAMYRIINKLSQTGEIDELLGRLNVFTQDSLAPMRMKNGLSFVRDFERLLGPQFFARIKSFTPMLTETTDFEGELAKYVERLESLGGIDIFFLGLGPEANAASHLCYIKPNSGAAANDIAGVIPISPSILEHHISKFKAGGCDISVEDEAECRAATHILTLGPAAILGAKRIVQSIVDASTAPAKRASFGRFLETELANDETKLAKQADENPGLWVRMHPDVRCYVLPDLLEE